MGKMSNQYTERRAGERLPLQKGQTMIYLPGDQGQGLVEYAVIIMLIALVVILAVMLFGNTVSSLYSRVVAEWPSS